MKRNFEKLMAQAKVFELRTEKRGEIKRLIFELKVKDELRLIKEKSYFKARSIPDYDKLATLGVKSCPRAELTVPISKKLRTAIRAEARNAPEFYRKDSHSGELFLMVEPLETKPRLSSPLIFEDERKSMEEILEIPSMDPLEIILESESDLKGQISLEEGPPDQDPELLFDPKAIIIFGVNFETSPERIVEILKSWGCNSIKEIFKLKRKKRANSGRILVYFSEVSDVTIALLSNQRIYDDRVWEVQRYCPEKLGGYITSKKIY